MKLRSIAAFLLCLLLTAGAAGAVEVETISVSRETEVPNLAPIARDMELRTYRGTSVGGSLQAVDPEGDPVSFRLCSLPGKGDVSLNGQDFVYTPAPGKKGRDSFTYLAVDSGGNESAQATVTIRIEKQSGKTCYADMAGDPAAYAALRLAEEGVFVGERVGTAVCFSPEQFVSRGEFLAMCAALTGMRPLEGVGRTGFYDDDTISLWLKPYVSAALMYGVVQGCAGDNGRVVFSPDRPISLAEAAVMLDNFLELTEAVDTAASEDVPLWAAKAVSNLAACDICPSSFQAGLSLTRGDAAVMLSAAMDVCAERGRKISRIWAD